MKIIDAIKIKIKKQRLIKQHSKAVKELGGLEYSTKEFKNSVITRMNEISRREKGETIKFILGFISGVLASIIASFIFQLIGK